MTKFLFRKLFSFIVIFRLKYTTVITYLYSKLNTEIFIGAKCEFHDSIFLSAIGKGRINIGDRCSFGSGVKIIAENGEIIIGDDVFIGHGTTIICQNKIEIKHGSQIAEYVTIRDQDHKINNLPINISGFDTSPIVIGANVWIGCKCTILRGSSIGDSCVVGANSLVKSNIPENFLAFGLPARPVRNISRTQ